MQENECTHHSLRAHMKVCSCGKAYTPSEWIQLPLVGYQSGLTMKGEMRNCSCNSTLLVITNRK